MEMVRLGTELLSLLGQVMAVVLGGLRGATTPDPKSGLFRIRAKLWCGPKFEYSPQALTP